jgi:putative membrane protein
VSIGSGKLVPELASGSNWPYTAIGIGFAILGVICSAYGLRRHREVERSIARGEFAAPDAGMLLVISGAGVVLGLLLVIVLLAEG